MTKPERPSGGEFTKREIVLFIFVMMVATFVTIGDAAKMAPLRIYD
jgi:hypothetical protein